MQILKAQHFKAQQILKDQILMKTLLEMLMELHILTEILQQILMDQILMDMKMQILILKTKELLTLMCLKKMKYKNRRTQQLKNKFLED